MFNHNHLFYFYTVVRQGGVNNASEYLRIAQPSLSIQIKTLEDKIQRNLFQKIGRKLELTSEGKVVFSYCERIFGVVDELADYLNDVHVLKQQKIKLGVTADIDKVFITDMLSSLLLNTKGNNNSIPLISMLSGSHETNLEKTLDNKIDVFISNRAVVHKGIIKLSEIKMPIIAVASSSFANINKFTRNETVESLLNKTEIKLVMPGENLSLRMETNYYLQKIKLKNPIIFESDILTSVVSAIKDGLGIGFLPLPFVFNEIHKKRLVSFGTPHFHWNHKIYLYGKENTCMDPLLKDFQVRFENILIGATA